MSKKNNNSQSKSRNIDNKIFLWVIIGLCVASIGFYLYTKIFYEPENMVKYLNKLDVIESNILSNDIADNVGDYSAGKEAKQVAFISVCDTKERAKVYSSIGETLTEALNGANKKVINFLKNTDFDPVWVKVDVVSDAERISKSELRKRITGERNCFFRKGISFDDKYNISFLEAELNSAKIIDYDDGGFDSDNLTKYLKKRGLKSKISYPDNYIVFNTKAWFCDENNVIYPLIDNGTSTGRREIDYIDKDYALDLIRNSTDYLVKQAKENGDFIYGYYPRFDNEIDTYNMLRHAGTVWSLICKYEIDPDEEIVPIIKNGIKFLVSNIIYTSDDTAYLLEEKSQELKLGGCGLAVIALTEYMDVFGDNQYKDICTHLGNGILTMLDLETGKYYHVFNSDGSKKEEYRTVYYDGEASYALCKLYGLDGDEKWLNAAMKTFDYFIDNDYENDCSQWIAYSLDEVTKYTNDPKIYEFALKNFQSNVDALHREDGSSTYAELVGCVLDTYDRMINNNIDVEYAKDNFKMDDLMRMTNFRMQRLLDYYFYPELAMYMENPSRNLNAFMVRHDGFRCRIDDVQHSMGGICLYYKHYDRLIECGILDNKTK